MLRSPEFQAVVHECVGHLSQAEVVDRTGISPAYVHAIVTKGRIPSHGIVRKLADGLRVTARQRARLFEAAGYADETPPAEPDELSREAMDLARAAAPLTSEELEDARRLIEDRELFGAVRLMMRRRVGHGELLWCEAR